MNNSKGHFGTLLHLWLAVGVAGGAVLGVIFIGNVLIIGARLRFVHPALEWGFYGVIIVFVSWMSYVFIFAVFCAPVVALEDIGGQSSVSELRALKRVARKLARSASQE
jgi:hypothetical protein